MFGLSALMANKDFKELAIVAGVTIGALTAFNYYYQIRLSRLRIKELEAKGL